MRSPRLSIGLGSFLVALALVVAVGIGSAIAVIPNQGTYYACLTKSTGAIKVINYPKVKCPKGQKLLSWSQQGPAGPQGPQGAQGPAGPADWNAIPDKPAGFADGVDNEGVTSVRFRTMTSTTPAVLVPNSFGTDTVDCPAGFIAVGGGHVLQSGQVDVMAWESRALDVDTWSVSFYKTNAGMANATVAAQVTCLRAEPAGIALASKNSNFGGKRVKGKVPK